MLKAINGLLKEIDLQHYAVCVLKLLIAHQILSNCGRKRHPLAVVFMINVPLFLEATTTLLDYSARRVEAKMLEDSLAQMLARSGQKSADLAHSFHKLIENERKLAANPSEGEAAKANLRVAMRALRDNYGICFANRDRPINIQGKGGITGNRRSIANINHSIHETRGEVNHQVRKAVQDLRMQNIVAGISFIGDTVGAPKHLEPALSRMHEYVGLLGITHSANFPNITTQEPEAPPAEKKRFTAVGVCQAPGSNLTRQKFSHHKALFSIAEDPDNCYTRDQRQETSLDCTTVTNQPCMARRNAISQGPAITIMRT